MIAGVKLAKRRDLLLHDGNPRYAQAQAMLKLLQIISKT